VFQTLNGIAPGGHERLGGDGQDGDEERRGQRQGKSQQVDSGPEGEVGQPGPHDQPGDWPGGGVRHKNEEQEILDQQADDARLRGPQDFADSDFLGPLRGRKGSQAEQPQPGHEGGEEGEYSEVAAKPPLAAVELVETVLEKIRVERTPREDFLPLGLDAGNCAGRPGGLDPDRILGGKFRKHEDGRMDVLP